MNAGATPPRYAVNETFHSWQGEGVHAGRSAFFIRLQGCPVRCPWCDSADTWREGTGKSAATQPVPTLVAEARAAAGAEFVVITGGEPAAQDLAPLSHALHEAGRRVHLETCGAFTLRGNFDWVTLSPKRAATPLPENLARADEFKWIIASPDDLLHWAGLWERHTPAAPMLKTRPVWLHPEWSRRADATTLATITDWVRTRGAPFRAGWQLHKCYGAR
ncbi:MAG: 7-carboxy-7-deazaguanine synthase QueE [Puniceicoccales bacterium]|jgi:organic radical activating enzyme|nr:7-carboxy-7-deazaguanine synthase QueE [Puniceicoccales bacterium]